MTSKGWRALDANLNRIAEGLRVIEEYSRFGEPQPELAGELRRLRHDVRTLGERLDEPGRLLQARAAADFGAAYVEGAHADPAAVRAANWKRVQEGLRVLEEFLRWLVPALAPEAKVLRYRAYELERRVELGPAETLDYSLYVILDPRLAGGRPLTELTAAALGGGATILQLREKSLGGAAYYELAAQLQRLCQAAGATFVVNDRVAVAQALGAALHLGPEDLPLPEARRLLGPRAVIGYSAGTAAEARWAAEVGATYLGVGPVFPTASKADAGEPLGLEGLAQVLAGTSLPVVAIGGITPMAVGPVLAAGARGVAVLSGILAAPDPLAATKDYRRELRLAAAQLQP